MSVSKRANGTYQVRWRRHPGGPQESKGGFRLRRDAVAYDAKMHDQIARGTAVDQRAGRETVRDYGERWRAVQPHRWRTAERVELQLRLHVYPQLGDRAVASVRPSDVDALVRRLELTLAPGTVRSVFSTVRALFKAAVRDRVLGVSPCVGVGFVGAPPKRLAVMSTGQVLAVADAIDGRYAAMVLAGAGLGLRYGELAGLTVDRVDFLRRTVTVDRQLAGGGRTGHGPAKTAGSERTVPLPDAVGAALAAHLGAYRAGPDGLMFTTASGRPVYRNALGRAWAAACATVDVAGFTPHDLRHFYASVLIASGASVKVVQARLGHTSAMTTLDTYGHLFADDDDRTRSAVDDAFAHVDAPTAATR